MKGKAIILQIKGLTTRLVHTGISKVCKIVKCAFSYIGSNFFSYIAGRRRVVQEQDTQCEGFNKYHIWSKKENEA